MQVARLVGVLAIALAFVLTANVPERAAPGAERTSLDGPLVLIDEASIDSAAVVAAGAQVVVDYHNGLLLIRVPSFLAAELADTRGADVLADRTTIDVWFSGTQFDTAKGEPSIPQGLKATSTGAYLVQFIGPIRSEWIADLTAAGLTFDTHLASFAFIVEGTPDAINAAKAYPYVQWVGTFQPAYKIESGLIGREGNVRVSITGFADGNPFAIADRVTAAGAQVEQVWFAPPVVIATMPAGNLAAVAQLMSVVAIQEYFQPMPLDRIAGQIHKYSSAWDTRRSGLTSTLTGRSPGPDGIMYTADDYSEGAGILDTGFDEGDPNNGANDFFASPNGDRVTRLFRHVGPTADGKCGSAHGTHVAGIIGGDGYSWERYLIENVGDSTVSTTDKEWVKSEAGVAPESKISIDGTQNGNDLTCGNGLAVNIAYWDCQYLNGYITIPITVGVSAGTCGNPWIDGANVATHNTAIDAGSRAWFAVHSNSWGSGGRTYGGTASGADTRMNAAPERLVVQAAGNDGPGLNSVSGEALLKNGLSVGASDNFRPEQFESDNPNLMAGFSSRGGPSESNGRIKPDLVAIGTSVASLFARGETLSTGFTAGADLITYVDKYCSIPKAYCTAGDTPVSIPDYRFLQGTSMATPHAAGLALLTREYLREVAANNVPSSPYYNPPSYLVKAVMINGAVRMDPNLYEYPGYDQGWGRIDLEQSLFPPVPRTNQFAIGSFTTTGSWFPTTINRNVVAGDVPLKVSLVWLDTPGDALSRNLDLIVRSPSGLEYHGNQYTNGWTDPVKTTYDNVNNVEQVEVLTPETGVWNVTVRGVSIPSTAPFALVFSGDVGPTATYKVDLSTTYPTAVTVAPSGSVTIPLTVGNFGTVTDTVALSSNAPAGLTVQYYPTNAVPLASAESQDVLAVISASAGITPGIYEFDLRAVSSNDPRPTPASDFVPVRVEVLASALPFPIRVTNATVDELDPSVVTFTDAPVGSHIFITYRKTSKVAPNGLTGGVNVWVAHANLDANGQPGAFTQAMVSNANEDPNDLRILRFTAGNLKNRIAITWTGSDPAETNPDARSWARIAYLDPPYTGVWTVVMIEKNEGTANVCNVARVSFPLFRAAPGLSASGQLIYVWETLAYGSGCTGNPTAVVSSAKTSTNGGASWSVATQVFPPPANTNFYFFPNGVVDQNDVAWIFVYWRTPTGNNRKLTVRLLDDGGWSAFPRNDYTILSVGDNAQWPAALSTTEGGNRVYVTFTRDNLQADLKQYLIYATGTYSSTVIPADYRDAGATGCGPGCLLSMDFSLPSGSGLRGPYGTSVSSANYNRRPILNIVQTGDNLIWLPNMENANPYLTPNLYTYYSGDGFGSNNLTILTSDAFAKGHQMSSTLTAGGTSRVYETYHSSRGTATNVNYDVYLLIYFAGWPTAPDTLGPLVDAVAGTPNPVNKTATFRISANFNDITTGKSNVTAAEYSIDVPTWPGTAMAVADAAFDSPTEATYADVNAGALGWGDAQCHWIYVRGRDAASNWGPVGSYQQCTDIGNVDRTPPVAPVLNQAVLSPGPSYASVILTWSASPDEAQMGGTVAYRVYRATGLGGTPTQLGLDIPAGTVYTYTDVGAGDGNANIYLYRIRSVDAAGNEGQSVAQGGKFTRPVGAGWQLLSVPVVAANPALSSVLQTLAYTRARTYVASDTADPWKAYVSVKGPQDFPTTDDAMAIWVYMSAADTFTVAGLVPGGVTINLQKGWNFVGFPSWRATPYTVANLQAAVPLVTAVEGYNGLGPYFLGRMVTTDALQQGFGYWVYAADATQWVVP